MATIPAIKDGIGKRQVDGVITRISWTLDGAGAVSDVGSRETIEGSGEVTLAVELGSDFGGATLSWYSSVTIQGTERVRRIAESDMTDDTASKTVYLNPCKIWPELPTATDPDVTAFVC